MLTGIGELVTNDEAHGGLLGSIRNSAVVMEGAEVRWVGAGGDLPDRWRGARTIDVQGRAVCPGFVDAHSHLVFAGDRSGEFARRMEGESYQSIAAGGGGILATVEATRAAGLDDLVATTRRRLERMLATGTTTIEIKSGYGLDASTESRLLEAAARAAEELPLTIRRTFLGAHAVPPEYKDDRAGFVDYLIEEMLPACAPHADFCDVFVEAGAFEVDDARRILVAGQEVGLGSRVHAEQLDHTGGAALAAEMGAVSADHLDHATQADAELLASAGTAAVLVPGASFQLRQAQAPGPMLWSSGVTVALATDCNPGTSFIESMSFVVALGVVQMGLSPDQALWAATRGGALSLKLDDRGLLAEGKKADLVVLEAPSYHHLAYRPASDLIAAVVAGGRPDPRLSEIGEGT